MAKKSRNNIVTTSFHYLVKTTRNEKDPQSPVETGFERHEFQRVVKRISDPAPLNDRDANVIERIKAGTDLPFGEHEVVDGYLHFGRFDGAYYGQQFRNNQLGIISADSLNLRPFHYLITHLHSISCFACADTCLVRAPNSKAAAVGACNRLHILFEQ